MLRRLLAFVVLPLLLTACRVDVTVDVTLAPDGTGEIVATAVADAELVGQVPGLAQSLAFDDAIAAGWTVEGPTATDSGGLTVTLRHPVTSAEDATNLLASLGPPFTGLTVTRTVEGDTTTFSLTGAPALPTTFDAFADADYLAALGGSPFADELAASGATPGSALGATLRARLPGAVDTANGESADGVTSWAVPADGSPVSAELVTQMRPESQPGWAKALATIALVLLAGWLIVSAVLITAVVRRRR